MEKQTERLKNQKEKGSDWMEKRKAMSNGSGKERAEKTVRGRIFVTNAWMILTTLLAIALVNLGIFKLYWEAFEHDWEDSLRRMTDSGEIEELVKQWTLHQQSFYLLVFADLVICCILMILIASLFTRNLVSHMMKPLEELERGAKRIRNNDLTEEITYQGETEFESIAATFNDMQAHLLSEREKNRKYEKARTEMIAGISHDLRTPLTAVRGTIKALLDQVVKDPAMKEKFLKTAYKRTGDMDVLLNQLFYLSKLETGNMPMNLTLLDLPAFVNSYVTGKREITDQKELELVLDLDESTVAADRRTENEQMAEKSRMIEADPEQLQRIFDNLIENSLKYSRAEHLQIRISLEQKGNRSVLCFEDNGVGVPEEKLSRIFEEFYREDSSRNQKEGNGLGLYIVKCLVESMNGRVWAENRKGLAICMSWQPVRDGKE